MYGEFFLFSRTLWQGPDASSRHLVCGASLDLRSTDISRGLSARLTAAALLFTLLASCGGGGGSPQSTNNLPSATGVTLNLLAGSIGGPGHLDGSGAAARFSGPAGVVADSAGNLYVTDGVDGGMIRKITPAGAVTTFVGSTIGGSADGTGAAAAFYWPTGIAIDIAGNLYVTDTGGGTVRKVTPEGVVTTLAGSFFEPEALALDSSGTVYVADSQNDEIRKITPQGLVTTFVAKSAGLLGPEGIAVNAAGTVYVSDTYSAVIRQITPEGTMTTLAGSGNGGCSSGMGSSATFYQPQGMSVNAAGIIYVADTVSAIISKVTPEGLVTAVAGACRQWGSADGTAPVARFAGPGDVAVGAGGVLYVADSFNNTIRQISASGVVTTIAGAASVSGNADGTGAGALFASPSAIVADTNGDLYVADTGNSEIRRITPQGVVTTLAAQLEAAPYGIGVGGDGSIYITEPGQELVQKITPQGVVINLAGGTYGSANGTGSAAQFNGPAGLAVNSAGIVYVADTNNCTLRAITPGGVVTTLAGTANQCGASVDGAGAAARFQAPTSVALDAVGNIYVSDGSASTSVGRPPTETLIREVTPQGAVTTLVSGAGLSFAGYGNLAIDGAGNLYVADTNNHEVRKITPQGSTIIGTATRYGIALDPLPAALGSPAALAVLPTGQLAITDGNAILVTEGL